MVTQVQVSLSVCSYVFCRLSILCHPDILGRWIVTTSKVRCKTIRCGPHHLLTPHAPPSLCPPPHTPPPIFVIQWPTEMNESHHLVSDVWVAVYRFLEQSFWKSLCKKGRRRNLGVKRKLNLGVKRKLITLLVICESSLQNHLESHYVKKKLEGGSLVEHTAGHDRKLSTVLVICESGCTENSSKSLCERGSPPPPPKKKNWVIPTAEEEEGWGEVFTA